VRVKYNVGASIAYVYVIAYSMGTSQFAYTYYQLYRKLKIK